jgi:hypothetical protein
MIEISRGDTSTGNIYLEKEPETGDIYLNKEIAKVTVMYIL